MRAGQLLGLHWTTVYRLRRRFLADPVASSVLPRPPGPEVGETRIAAKAESIINAVLEHWLPRQRRLAHPMRDVTMEVRSRCRKAGIGPVSRATVARRWKSWREEQDLALAQGPDAAVPPGHLVTDRPLELVQIDHTQADLFIVDEVQRRTLGGPWVSVAIDVATRAVLGFCVAMERPNAAAVALLLTRVVLPKAPWLASIGLTDLHWPMSGLPALFLSSGNVSIPSPLVPRRLSAFACRPGRVTSRQRSRPSGEPLPKKTVSLADAQPCYSSAASRPHLRRPSSWGLAL